MPWPWRRRRKEVDLSQYAVFRDAAEIVLHDLRIFSGAPLNSQGAQIDSILQEAPHLKISTQERQIAYGVAEKKRLKLADMPYLDGMKALIELGAAMEDIKGGYAQNQEGRPALISGTRDKEGAGTQRMYTRCTFSVPCDKLNRDKATAIVETAELAQEVTKKISWLFKNEYMPFRQESWRFRLQRDISHQAVIDLGEDFGTASERLALLRENLEKVVREKSAAVEVDDILPSVPQEVDGKKKLVIELQGKPEIGALLIAAADKGLFAQEGHRKWEMEEQFRESGIDAAAAKLPAIFAKLGFPGASVSRKPGHLQLDIAFPEEITADRLEKFQRGFFACAKRVSAAVNFIEAHKATRNFSMLFTEDKPFGLAQYLQPEEVVRVIDTLYHDIFRIEGPDRSTPSRS